MTGTAEPTPSNDTPTVQRVDEWLQLDPVALRYHQNQWAAPKQSTLAFEHFAAQALRTSSSVIDLGCGAGAATAYIARQHPSIEFCGHDYVPALVDMANSLSQQNLVRNLKFVQSDWFNLKEVADVDGVVSLQTLSWLPEFETPLGEIFKKIRPRWIALSSLFYEGDIACRIEVNEFKRSAKSFYNVYALPDVDRFCRRHGYAISRSEPFKIDIDLEKPADPDIMGTYTRRVQEEGGVSGFERLQISGPLLMSWHMVMIERM